MGCGACRPAPNNEVTAPRHGGEVTEKCYSSRHPASPGGRPYTEAAMKPETQTWAEFLDTRVTCPHCDWQGKVRQTEAVFDEIVCCPECGTRVEKDVEKMA